MQMLVLANKICILKLGHGDPTQTQNHKTMPKYVIYRGQVMSYEMYLLELAAK
jgi:hypothetical protein